MNPRKRATFEALQRILAFVTTDPLPTPLQAMPPKFQDHVTALKVAMQEAQGHVTVLLSGEVEQCMRLRVELRAILHSEHVTPIREAVRLMRDNGYAVSKQFRYSWKGEAYLLESARGILRDVTPYLATLIEMGLSPTVLQDFEQTLSRLENAATRYNVLRPRRRLARSCFCEALRRAGVAKVDLNAIIVRYCQADPVDGPVTFLRWKTLAQIRLPERSRIRPGHIRTTLNPGK